MEDAPSSARAGTSAATEQADSVHLLAKKGTEQKSFRVEERSRARLSSGQAKWKILHSRNSPADQTTTKERLEQSAA